MVNENNKNGKIDSLKTENDERILKSYSEVIRSSITHQF